MKIFPDIPGNTNLPALTVTNASGLNLPVDEDQLIKLMNFVEERENVIFKEIEAVYVDEAEIIEINKKYLDHDYVTDIITFRYDEQDNRAIEGTLYCCAPRIAEQSKEFGTEVESEFLRVFIHGLIHLSGYDDKTEEEKSIMTELENYYLKQLTKEL